MVAQGEGMGVQSRHRLKQDVVAHIAGNPLERVARLGAVGKGFLRPGDLCSDVADAERLCIVLAMPRHLVCGVLEPMIHSHGYELGLVTGIQKIAMYQEK
jgi:hypothetical protein